jgi:hypothetical protein
LPEGIKPLIDVREEESFLTDERDLKAALIHVRRFATPTPVASWEEAGEIADAIKDLRLVISAAEQRRKATNAPYEATVGQVNAHYKELLAQPNAAVAKLKEKAAAFKEAEEERERERRRKAQEKLDREAETAAAEAQAAAERAAQEPSDQEARQASADAHAEAARAATATVPSVESPKQVRGTFGTVGTRTDYQFVVTDSSSVPAEFLTVNEKAVKAAIKGERAMAKAQERSFNLELIPGVTITPEKVQVSR